MNTKHRIGLKLVNLSIALILLGFAGLIQPFAQVLYQAGFPLILAGVILFNVASHL